MTGASRRASTTIINRRVSRLGPVAAAAAPSQAREVARGGGQGPWTPGQSIEQMDKFWIGVAILSLTQMGDVIYDIYDNTEKGRAAVRTVNEFGAKCMHDYPKRFGLFASIPFPARMLHTECRGRH